MVGIILVERARETGQSMPMRSKGRQGKAKTLQLGKGADEKKLGKWAAAPEMRHRACVCRDAEAREEGMGRGS